MVKVYTITKGETLGLKVISQYEDDGYCYNPGYCVWLLNKYFNLNELGFEQLYCIAIDSSNEILGIMMISSGDLLGALLFEDLIAFFILSVQADSFSIFHNHPRDTLEASTDDIESAAILKNLSEHLKIKLNDSFIVAGNKCTGILSEKTYNVDDFEEGEEE